MRFVFYLYVAIQLTVISDAARGIRRDLDKIAYPNGEWSTR